MENQIMAEHLSFHYTDRSLYQVALMLMEF